MNHFGVCFASVTDFLAYFFLNFGLILAFKPINRKYQFLKEGIRANKRLLFLP